MNGLLILKSQPNRDHVKLIRVDSINIPTPQLIHLTPNSRQRDPECVSSFKLVTNEMDLRRYWSICTERSTLTVELPSTAAPLKRTLRKLRVNLKSSLIILNCKNYNIFCSSLTSILVYVHQILVIKDELNGKQFLCYCIQ